MAFDLSIPAKPPIDILKGFFEKQKRPRLKRSDQNQYIKHLRVLDALDADAEPSEISETIQYNQIAKEQNNSYASTQGATLIRDANKMLSQGFKYLILKAS